MQEHLEAFLARTNPLVCLLSPLCQQGCWAHQLCPFVSLWVVANPLLLKLTCMTWEGAQLSACLACRKPWAQSLAPQETDSGAGNLNTRQEGQSLWSFLTVARLSPAGTPWDPLRNNHTKNQTKQTLGNRIVASGLWKQQAQGFTLYRRTAKCFPECYSWAHSCLNCSSDLCICFLHFSNSSLPSPTNSGYFRCFVCLFVSEKPLSCFFLKFSGFLRQGLSA